MEHSDDGNRQVGDEAIERSNISDFESRGAVNSLILDYYKKFGRKRDLEQFFSLSTAQGDIRDTSGTFWMKMKSENDSSDGERKSDSSHEVCRISIRCSVPESSSQEDEPQTKSGSPRTTSPPIIIEELGADDTRHSDDDFNKSDDNNSQKSLDALLDLSSQKPLSPTSSVTSQRKLEWDSLADVGYGNETDRKTSASSLSTLERLALKPHCSNNDSKDLGPPASQSTPNDDKDKQKTKKGIGKKTKIYQKDIDFVEVNVPKSESNPQSINVNLTKHISFNVEKDGGINIDTVKSEVNVSPEKVIDAKVASHTGMDKESQTSLNKPNNYSAAPIENPIPLFPQRIPVMISLNTLRKRLRKKRSRVIKRKVRNQKKVDPNGPQEKSGEQLSAAESFEYLPGHIYNQNQINQPKAGNSTGNKSSLESSAANTTESSKGSKHSLTKDLDKCIDVLKTTLQKRGNDSDLKNKLIKEIVLRLMNAKYRDDDSPTEFLSGLSFNSARLGLKNNTTSSTSDANNTDDSHRKTPRKSILRVDKFNPNVVSSTSQSVPNLLAAASNEKFITNLTKIRNSNTESDSSKGKSSSDNVPKTSSEELYLKYLEALRREQAYKRHLREKETFLKQKLVSSDTVFKVPVNREPNVNRRLNELIKDLTRNNYDDGSGDASKLEGSLSNVDNSRLSARNQRSHSVFTLSSCNSERQKRPNLKKKMHSDRDCDAPGSSGHYCCCPHHFAPTAKVDFVDSSVQVNFRCFEELESNSKSKTNVLTQNCTECRSTKNSPRDLEKCACKTKCSSMESDRVYKCAKKYRDNQDCESNKSSIGVQYCSDLEIQTIQRPHSLAAETCSSGLTSNYRRNSKSSQANLLIQMMTEGVYQGNPVVPLGGCRTLSKDGLDFKLKNDIFINEATRSLQTEISINPRIREPTLSDIIIVADCDCAKLISEQTRLVDPSDSSITKTYSNACTSSMVGKLLVPSEDNIFDNKTYDVNEGNNEQTNSKSIIDDYTIPIKGTGMSLQVRLGRAKNDPNRDIGTRSCGMDKQNAICVTDRVDQGNNDDNDYENAYPFSLPNPDNVVKEPTPCCSSYRNSNKLTKDTGKNKNRNLSPVSLVETHRKLNNPLPKTPQSLSPRKKSQDKVPVLKYLRSKSPENARNTYPKTVTVKQKPQFRRSNTDSEVIATKSNPSENNNDYDQNSKCSSCSQSNGTHSSPQPEKRKTVKSVSTETQSSLLEEEVVHVEPDSKKKVLRAGNTDIASSNTPKDPSKETKCTGSNTEPEVSDVVNLKNKEVFKSVGCNTESKDMPPRNVLAPLDEPKQVEKPATTSKYVDHSTDPIVSKDISSPTEEYKARFKTVDSTKVYEPSEKSTDSNTDTKNSSNSGGKLNKKITKHSPDTYPKDPIINMIQDITRRYTKNEAVKVKKKKCFKEIITVLSYLLETDDCTDCDVKTGNSSAEATSNENIGKSTSKSDKEFIDKGVQLSFKSERSTKIVTESSDIPISTDLPTSSDSAACKVLSKIKKECEKYHQKRCKGGRKCERSSSTSMNCEGCRKVHYCPCKSHKCKRKACIDKIQKKCVAYNLIIQNSEAVLSEDNVSEKAPLKNVYVNLPRKDIRKEISTKQTVYRVEKDDSSSRCGRNRSRSCPNENEVSSVDEMLRTQYCTVREYLEKNRPDFVEKCSQRQHCLKFINECRANERASQRKLVSMHVDQQPDLTSLSSAELRQLAQNIGLDLRRKKTAPKFMSEREMKKHSHQIYKTLPEVVGKKEEKRKDNIKKTNLLMANIFKKNLQKKTLGGNVNISNYSPVIKI